MNAFLSILSFALLVSLSSCTKESTDGPPPESRSGLYRNGNISTGTISNSGVNAPPGTRWSEAQHNTGTGTTNNIGGYACQYSSNSSIRLADDFTVPTNQEWNISKVSVYAFCGVSSTSPFDALRLRIWNGDPSISSSSIVYGDLSSNVLSESIDSLTYVILNTSVPAPGIFPNANNKVWKLSANISKKLPAGTYWLEWQVHEINDQWSYSPSIKIIGSRGLPTWNAIVFNSLKIWQKAVDLGNPSAFPAMPQDLPFDVEYTY